MSEEYVEIVRWLPRTDTQGEPSKRLVPRIGLPPTIASIRDQTFRVVPPTALTK